VRPAFLQPFLRAAMPAMTPAAGAPAAGDNIAAQVLEDIGMFLGVSSPERDCAGSS
jgi:hypothetical protein